MILIDAPVNMVLTLVEAKNWLKLESDVTEDNDAITNLILAATEEAEEYCDRSFITQERAVRFESFEEFQLPRSPVASITHIKYIDEDGVQQTWAATNYKLDLISSPCRVILKHGKEYPIISASEAGAIEIQYKSGYGDDATDVPKAIREAVKQIITFIYYNRADHARRWWSKAKDILSHFRVRCFV